MYAFKTKSQPETDVDFSLDEENSGEEICYWRKHPNLHGWMENLYDQKGGTEEFNCVNVKLNSDDLDALERDLNAARLPQTSGFFFGASDGSLDEINFDLQFVKDAREAINQGYTVYYTSWW